MNNKNDLALTVDCSSPSGLAGKRKEKFFASHTHYSTGVNPQANDALQSKSGGY